jgi:hypothetical protein
VRGSLGTVHRGGVRWVRRRRRRHGCAAGAELRRGLALLLAGADPQVAVAGGPAAALLLHARAGADPVRDAGEGVVLALPRAHTRLRHATAVV